MRTLTAAVLVALLALPGPCRAQDKTTLLADYARAKSTVLAYVDAMPDSALGFRPTPGVRSFAEQIDHIVSTHFEVAAMTLGNLAKPGTLGDTTTYLHNTAALRAASAKAFDYALAALQKATTVTLANSMSIYDQPAAPAFKWMAMSLEHGAWTLGQTVPYLRLNKVTPPTYQIPF